MVFFNTEPRITQRSNMQLLKIKIYAIIFKICKYYPKYASTVYLHIMQEKFFGFTFIF